MTDAGLLVKGAARSSGFLEDDRAAKVVVAQEYLRTIVRLAECANLVDEDRHCSKSVTVHVLAAIEVRKKILDVLDLDVPDMRPGEAMEVRHPAAGRQSIQIDQRECLEACGWGSVTGHLDCIHERVWSRLVGVESGFGRLSG
ncbi:hypothetical protein AMJ39_05245 [candidate division TA06 bacterium DG_24]|uniref:Uncharacterized protein n=2 Tax=Bacteria division TA06 TaxID=1156500 RepID=A0A0S8JDR8_UNCT6|nr:MAG: hypothetical protein AMJ39_05245 [candidate division TA06 bacterium DG_24]KPL07839.1 MAG: hypothetical protein AMJ71_08835 [candidate division TA06 bacterium SM1_40]